MIPNIPKNDIYKFEEISVMPTTRKLAIEKLEKFVRILKYDIPCYLKRNPDIDISRNAIVKQIKMVSEKIYKVFNNKKSLIKIKKSKIDKLYDYIQNYKPCKQELLPLPSEIIFQIIRYFSISDIKAISAVNRQGRAIAYHATILKAIELGYKESLFNSSINAYKQYLDSLFRTISFINKNKILSLNSLLGNENNKEKVKKINFELLLSDIKDCSSDQIVKIFSSKKINHYTHLYFTKYILDLLEVEELLVEPIDQKLCRERDNGLVHAVEKSSTPIVKILLRYGADSNVRFEYNPFFPGQPNAPKVKFYLLHLATINNDLEIVDLLFDYGAEINTVDGLGKTALCWAAEKGHSKIADRLLKYGAEMNLAMPIVHSPLILSVMNHHFNCVKVLLKYGAETNNQNNRGDTALNWAAYYADKDMVEILLLNNADPNITDRMGRNPLHNLGWGYINENRDRRDKVEIAKMLIEHGAKINHKSLTGRTPLDVVMYNYTEKGNKLLKDYLIKQGGVRNFVEATCNLV